jgi:hypothetical protein
MESIFTKLIEQLPSAVAIIIVVVYFIRYIGKRDEQEFKRGESTTTILTNLSVIVANLAEKQETNHEYIVKALGDMKSATRRRKDGNAG